MKEEFPGDSPRGISVRNVIQFDGCRHHTQFENEITMISFQWVVARRQRDRSLPRYAIVRPIR